jgi:hypothetical protein
MHDMHALEQWHAITDIFGQAIKQSCGHERTAA